MPNLGLIQELYLYENTGNTNVRKSLLTKYTTLLTVAGTPTYRLYRSTSWWARYGAGLHLSTTRRQNQAAQDTFTQTELQSLPWNLRMFLTCAPTPTHTPPNLPRVTPHLNEPQMDHVQGRVLGSSRLIHGTVHGTLSVPSDTYTSPCWWCGGNTSS